MKGNELLSPTKACSSTMANQGNGKVCLMKTKPSLLRTSAMIVGLGLAFGVVPAAHTATPSSDVVTSSGFQFVADAYGTQATLGNVVVAGKTAVSTLGACGIVEP